MVWLRKHVPLHSLKFDAANVCSPSKPKFQFKEKSCVCHTPRVRFWASKKRKEPPIILIEKRAPPSVAKFGIVRRLPCQNRSHYIFMRCARAYNAHTKWHTSMLKPEREKCQEKNLRKLKNMLQKYLIFADIIIRAGKMIFCVG